jgi:hypothetical protein
VSCRERDGYLYCIPHVDSIDLSAQSGVARQHDRFTQYPTPLWVTWSRCPTIRRLLRRASPTAGPRDTPQYLSIYNRNQNPGLRTLPLARDLRLDLQWP